jgi:hypothetical protein
MGINLILFLGVASLVFAFWLSLRGLYALWLQSQHVPNLATASPISITLEGKGSFTPEPGVLLDTLWEHLPNASCQSGECGGCKLRLLEGQVNWIREPIVEIDRRTHILACSCQALSPLRCALV